ncbi:hypothetical protein GCM10009844_24210 [Nocardioides koreensis]|uniref:Uncharacterized protein n=1 Tax=Nocardioides koreensis TaxID=433651 RepID=A0ABP5LIX4_9ACTN
MVQPADVTPPAKGVVISLLAHRRARRATRNGGWPLCLERCRARSAVGQGPPAEVIDLSLRRDPAS